MDKKKGKARPYGIYDEFKNSGWVIVGTDHNTAEFSVQSIRLWLYEMGKTTYPETIPYRFGGTVLMKLRNTDRKQRDYHIGEDSKVKKIAAKLNEIFKNVREKVVNLFKRSTYRERYT